MNIPIQQSNLLLILGRQLVRFNKHADKLDGLPASQSLMRSIVKTQKEIKQFLADNPDLPLRQYFLHNDNKQISIPRITAISFMLGRLMVDEDCCQWSLLVRIIHQTSIPCTIQASVIVVHNMVRQGILIRTDEPSPNPHLSLAKKVVDEIWSFSEPLKTLPTKYANRFALTFPKP